MSHLRNEQQLAKQRTRVLRLALEPPLRHRRDVESLGRGLERAKVEDRREHRGRDRVDAVDEARLRGGATASSSGQKISSSRLRVTVECA